MNKILNVNLGGYPLTIDDDAYEYLHKYLEAIRSRFSASEGRDEILSDVENRMGELLQQRLGNRIICTLADIEYIVKVMGKPEDFGDGSQQTGTDGRQRDTSKHAFRSGKRLFRDEDEAVIGGVCSGIAAYLGIQDPVWVRLGFIILAGFSAGFWVLAYLILMIVVPGATTSADRLAMRGEPINVENIAREIERSFENFSNRMSGKGADFKKKSNSYESDGKIKSFLASIVNAIGQMMGWVILLLGKLSKRVLFFIAIALVLGLIISWIVGFWSFLDVSPHLHYFSPLSQAGNISAIVLVLFVIGLPVVSFLIMLLSAVFKGSISRYVQPGIWTFWTICLVALTFFAAKVGKSFKAKGVAKTETQINNLSSDTLFIQWAEQDLTKYNFRPIEFNFGWRQSNYEIDGPLVSNDALAVSLLPELRIAKSISDQFEILTEVYARGSTTREADEFAQNVGFKCDVENNNLYVPKTIIIPKGQKLRTYNINVDIKVPVGKYVMLGESIHKHVTDAYFDHARNNRNRFHKRPNQVFLMTKSGLVCVSCEDYGKGRFESDEEYQEFYIEGPLEVEFTEDDDFSIDFHGANEKDLVFSATDESIRLVNQSNQLRRVTIRCSSLKNLKLKRGVQANLFGFDHHEATIHMDDDCQISGKLDIHVLDVRMRNRCKLELMGNGGSLNLALAENSSALLFNFKTDSATVTAKNNSRAEIFVEDDYNVSSDESSKVEVNGRSERKSRKENI